MITSFSDILRELASFGDLQLKNSAAQPTHKRDREQELSPDSAASGEPSSAAMDESSRPRKPIPRAKGSNNVPIPSRQTQGPLPTSSSSASLSSMHQSPPVFDTPPSNAGPSQPQQPPPNFIAAAAVAAGLNPDANPFEWNPSMVGTSANAGVPLGVGMNGMGIGMGMNNMGGYDMMMNNFGAGMPPVNAAMFSPGAAGRGQGWYGPRAGVPQGQVYPDPLGGIQNMTDMFLPNFFAAAAVSNGGGYSSMPPMAPLTGPGSSSISPDATPSPASAASSGQQQGSTSNSSPWGGILSAGAQQPYNVGYHRTGGGGSGPGVGTGDEFFAPFSAYSGAGGTAALAAEAQAIIGTGEGDGGNGNWSAE